MSNLTSHIEERVLGGSTPSAYDYTRVFNISDFNGKRNHAKLSLNGSSTSSTISSLKRELLPGDWRLGFVKALWK
jgi:hypothetical protein